MSKCKVHVKAWKYYPLGLVVAMREILEKLWDRALEDEKELLGDMMEKLEAYDNLIKGRI